MRPSQMSIGRLLRGLESCRPPADTALVHLRAKTVSPPSAGSNESGMALIELLMAMVMLNIGIFALIATFQSGSMALRRAAVVSNGAAVGDKVMENYRGLQNKAIYLNAPVGGGNDVSGMPNGIPNSTSSWYSTYEGDAPAYGSGAYYNYATPSATPLWVTQSTT